MEEESHGGNASKGRVQDWTLESRTGLAGLDRDTLVAILTTPIRRIQPLHALPVASYSRLYYLRDSTTSIRQKLQKFREATMQAKNGCMSGEE
jgi:hypothetical protein